MSGVAKNLPPRSALALMLALIVAASGCGAQPARSEVLGDIAETVVVPAYQQVAIEAENLEQTTNEFCTDPDRPKPDAVRSALLATRSAWSLTEAMWVGPAMERRSWAVIDWPVAVDEIEGLIADDSITIEVDLLARRVGADQRGLRALEYLFAAGQGRRNDLSLELDAERRCQYLTGLATVISDEADRLFNDWTVGWEDGPPYSELFRADGGGAIDSLVNDSLFLLEAMGDSELGRALGRMDGPADIEQIDEGPAGLGADDLKQHLAGLRSVLLGLGPLLDDDLTARLTAQLDDAQQTVETLQGTPLRKTVVATPDEVSLARDAIKAIQTTVATEIVSSLGVTIGFSDADGDTGA